MANHSNNDLTHFYQYVQEHGKLRTIEHAHRWSDGILRTLGVNLDRRTKKQLAKSLPDELAGSLGGVFWLLHFRDPNLSSYDFQRAAARRSGNTDAAFARYPILAVFAAIKQMIDADLDRSVADKLSPEVRELWQQAGQMAE